MSSDFACLWWDQVDACAPLTPAVAKRVEEKLPQIRQAGVDPDKTTCFIDVDSGDKYGSWSDEECPCITHSRGKSGGFYLTTHKRRTPPSYRSDQLAIVKAF
jgi:hypothetical protein